MEFSLETRKKDLGTLAGRYFDVLIIGGGIAGAGVASILAANGLDVILVDRADFASGTSSNSSKLIHGGIRYLGQGHVMVTMDLLRERNYLMKNTDFVKGIDFDILIDDRSWKRYTIAAGLLLYNLLGRNYSIPRFHKGKYSYPGFKGHYTYMDAVTDDAQLVIYNVITAKMLGAMTLNYVAAEKIIKENGMNRVTLRDTMFGGEYSVKCKVIVNSTGPWVGETYAKYSGKDMTGFKLSKGSHLIMKKDHFPFGNAVAFKSHIDGRQMFVIPRDETVIIGTTDDFVTSPDSLKVTDEEKDYIYESGKRLFPALDRSDIIGTYVGIRPLYGQGNDPGRVTRDFHIDVTGKMVSVMGVKITNYRTASRKVAATVGKVLGRKMRTSDLPQILYRRREEGDRIDLAINEECALTAEDILKRRLGYFYFKADQGEGIRDEITKRIKAKVDNLNKTNVI